MPRVPQNILTCLAAASILAARVACAQLSATDGSQDRHPRASLKPASASSEQVPVKDSDPQAEEQLYQLVNQARREAGAPPLVLDSGLTQAARAHARAMVDARQLSHQFEGEPSLPQRLAIATQLQLDQEAENVALDNDPEHGHQHLMQSPPHRANLLNPAYNVLGVGVVRSGNRLYIVQDFGHSLPQYSATELKERIAASVVQIRQQAGQPELQRRDLLIADEVACSMAQADKLGTAPVHKLAERFTVLTYASLHPETLPNSASHVLGGKNLHAFSIGSCFARSDTYPTGAYWVVLSVE